MSAEELSGGARKATKSKLFEFLVHGVRPGMPSGARMAPQGSAMGPPGSPYGGSPAVRPGMPQPVLDQTRKRSAPQQVQQQQQTGQSRARSAKRRKMADKILPQRIRELVPESQAYMDLLAFERKLDQTIMRKRVDIQEALKRPIKQKRKLRLYISNTFNPARHDAEDSDGKQIMTDVVGNPEAERRADFYQQPWSQEAVSRYFYCKIQQRRQELEQAMVVRNT
ncbi:SWI/SNF-related matrix-associated actin-dependent regulator of chromatin subfamily D member 3-like [Heterodontus francisci]|uniref:SWI/SNF-related matrix-associated actin-dependent regulator of chromatin subfamily D member 3-like n=1 Tax=Heterodontus francisci TaxID=7792 RepID=UPI00355C9488